jgi:hypothetical protein
MVSDIDFQAFSHAALVRLADEICVQMHLLTLGFQRAVARFAASDEQARDLVTRQLIGHAGLAAERLRRLTDVAPTPAGAVNVLRLHPLFNPLGYVDATIDGEVVSVAPSPAHDDNAWLAHCGPHSPEPLRAIVQGVNPHLDVEIQGSETEWSLVILERDAPSPERDEVAVTRFSTGTNFSFEPRKSIPLTVL